MNQLATDSERSADKSWRAGLIFFILVVGTLILVVMSNTDATKGGMVRNRTEVFLTEIQGGLDLYKIDHGEYPPNPAVDRDKAAEYGAHILYKYLSGDFDADGKFDTDDPSNKIYVESLDFRSSQRQGKGTVGIDPDGRYIATDSFGNPIRYLYDPRDPKTNQHESRTLNPVYDLWSIGEAEPGGEGMENKSKWITNWGMEGTN